MDALLGAIGFVGILIGIILMILGKIKKKKFKGGLIALVSFVLFIVAVAMAPTEGNEGATDTSQTEAKTKEVEKTDNPKEEKKPIELTEKQKMTQAILSLIDSKQAYDTGSYIQGDIPTGEYAFISFDGSGKYYVEKDAAGNIIDNQNFDSFGYVHVHGTGNIETKGVLISISAFPELGITSAKEIYEKMNDVQNYQDAGYYKVGVDIPAGSYVFESYGKGYVSIESGPIGKSDIIDNENFNGRYSVTVTDGQYLNVSRAKISQQ